MHPYSIDSVERFVVVAAIGALGVGGSYLIHLGQGLLPFAWPWWLEAPAAMGCAGILYRWFDYWGWRVRWVRASGVVSTPDLSGHWTGSGRSSHDGHETEFGAKLHIRQRWTTIGVSLETSSSRSESQTAAVTVNEGGSPELCYTYINRPKSGSVRSMEMHSGTATLRFHRAVNEADGEYYSGRGRQMEGWLSFRRNRGAADEGSPS